MLNNPEYVNIHRQITLSERTLLISVIVQCMSPPCTSLCAMLMVAVVYTFTAIKVRHHVAMFCMKGPNLLYTTAVDTTRSLLNDNQQEVCHAVGLTSILCIGCSAEVIHDHSCCDQHKVLF